MFELDKFIGIDDDNDAISFSAYHYLKSDL